MIYLKRARFWFKTYMLANYGALKSVRYTLLVVFLQPLLTRYRQWTGKYPRWRPYED